MQSLHLFITYQIIHAAWLEQNPPHVCVLICNFCLLTPLYISRNSRTRGGTVMQNRYILVHSNQIRKIRSTSAAAAYIYAKWSDVALFFKMCVKVNAYKTKNYYFLRAFGLLLKRLCDMTETVLRVAEKYLKD